MTRPIILASASEARRRLLENAGISVTVRAHGVDERSADRQARHRGATARDVALVLAERKALAVSRGAPDAIAIGADQTLEIDGDILSKPADAADARRQLARLAGRTHALHSAFCVAANGKIAARQAKTARLTMRALGQGEIDWYVDAVGADITMTVGGYRLEGLGARLFERIDGDYFTILGLPLLPLLKVLRKMQAIAP